MAKKALGKGLSALIPEYKETKTGGVTQLKITEITAGENQPRRKFAQDALNELAESIKEHGIVQPIVVRKKEDYYEIVAGERRWRAARLAGLKTVPVVIKDYSETQALEIALIENLQREDLNPIEEANAYKSLMDEHKISQEEIAKKIGKSRPAITNTLRLLNLDDGVKEFLISGEITAGHARALLAIDEKKKQIEVANKVIKEGLSVRQTEKMMRSKEIVPVKKIKSPEVIEIEDKLRNLLHTKVNVIHGKKKGKIEIEYYSIDDLDRILKLFNL